MAFAAGLAGIVGTVLAVVDRPPQPPPRTLAVWATEADAACDTTQADARELLRRALDALVAVHATGTEVTMFGPAELETAARAAEDAADAQRLILGRWRALPPPESPVDARRVADLVAHGDRFVDGLYDIGAATRRIDVTDPQAGVVAAVEATQHVVAVESRWQEFRAKARDVGIARCSF